MFTGTPLPPLHPLFENAWWAEGMVRWCNQSALSFGADRHIPVDSRPIVTLRRDSSRAVVLPCTSRDQSQNPSFREIVSPRDVLWVDKPSGYRTFAFWRYETVRPEMLRSKFGEMKRAARIALLKWVKERY